MRELDGIRTRTSRRSFEAMKRGVDVVGAAVGLVVLSPLIALLAAGIAVAVGRPVLFRQLRPGRGGETFELVKFRTMTDDRDADGSLLPDELRRHRFGQVLRRTSLDELPTLVNVLRGDMSLVGPRPLLVEYLPRYSAEQRKRHDVRPGMTGLAQIRGRNATTWEDRLASDVEYVQNRSMGMDLRILAATVGTLFRGGADSVDEPQLGKFSGCNSECDGRTQPQPVTSSSDR